MSIYLIAELREVNERGDTEPVIDFEDYPHGFFTSREAAEQYAEELDRPARERYEQRQREDRERIERWEAKNTEAKKRGFGNPDPYPFRSSALTPTFHTVVEVEPAVVEVKS